MPTPSLALLHNSLVRSPAPTPQHEPQPQKSTRPDYVPQSESQSISSSVRSEVPPENLHIGEKQLEDLLSLALDAQFYLEVMSDKADAKGHQESLGTIPVHLRVKELTIGGVSVPSIHAESLNRVVGPINFGNVRI
ncbi:hypothetical protein BGZ54_005553 [Gamsiella multidivaricata]|nr:hypothetical protein BGZ54_005553 [Gamsiella multidivaricata]